MLLYTQVISGVQQKRFFENVYTAYRGRMLALARRKLRTPEDAEDAVHQSFLSLAEHFDRLARLPRTELEAYLTVVVERKCIDILRQLNIPPQGCGETAPCGAQPPLKWCIHSA